MTKTTLWTLGLSAALLAGLSLAGCGKKNATPTGVAPAPAPTPATAPAKTTDHAAEVAAAEKAAQAWLGLLDNAKYAQSWKTAAPAFQKATSADFWATTAQVAREPLGKLQSRTLASAQYATSLPGAPDGEYVVIQYHSTFAKKQNALETVTPKRTPDGQWKVSGYFLK